MMAEFNSSEDRAQNLGELEKVDLRKIWAKEADHFSTWLVSEGLPLLSKTIGIVIQKPKLEVSTGSFSVDILAEEAETGNKIVIENQLEQSDHDHLGKLMTYAAGHKASIIIWIFKEIKEKHRSAIDWLNEKTDKETSFFALEINVYKIGNSKPAPKLEIVCKPNEWGKRIKRRDNILSTIEIQYEEFWQGLKKCAEDQKIKGIGGKFLFSQSPKPYHWYNITIGMSGTYIELTISIQNEVMGCHLAVNDEDFYLFLEKNKNEIEEKLGRSEWRKRKRGQSWVVSQKNEDFYLYNDTNLNDYFDWFIKKAELFHKTFVPYIKEYKEQPTLQDEDL